MDMEKAQALSPELQAALRPLLQALESESQHIAEYNQQIEQIAKEERLIHPFARSASGLCVGVLLKPPYSPSKRK